MNNSALKDIQQALNIIRAEIEKVDAETKMAALELIMSTSQSVVAMARKLTKPKVRTKTVAIPKTKIIKQRVAQPTKEKEPQNKPFFAKNREITKFIFAAVANGILQPYTNDSVTERQLMTAQEFATKLVVEQPGGGDDFEDFGEDLDFFK